MGHLERRDGVGMNGRHLARLMAVGATLCWGSRATAEEPLANFRRAAQGVYIGGEPRGGSAYDWLAALGVKTIVSVDGLPPDAEATRAHGIRPVHVPLGYGGIPDDACASLRRVAQECDRPIYVHCHHGKHRGPAAAAVIALAAGLLDKPQAKRLLQDAGANPEFRGLWRDVAEYDPTKCRSTDAPLRAATRVEPFALAMAQLGRAWTRAESEQREDEDAVVLHNDESRAVFLEALRETIRHAPSYDPSREIERRLASLDQLANAPSQGFRSDEISARCTRCHCEHRD